MHEAMHEQDVAIVRALVPVAWADGNFAAKEHEMLEALLDAYGASEAQRADLRTFAREPRTLDAIDLQDLSAGDRRVLLHHAVLLTYADGRQDPSEVGVLGELARRLRISEEEARAITAQAADRARAIAHLL